MSEEFRPNLSPKPRPVHLTRTLIAPAREVFDAWTVAERMRQWMFTTYTNEIRDVRVDLKPGGKFYVLAWDGVEEIEHVGEYRQIEPPSRLVFTLQAPKRFPGLATATMSVTTTSKGTVMMFTQTGVDRDVAERDWRAMFEVLAQVLRG